MHFPANFATKELVSWPCQQPNVAQKTSQWVKMAVNPWRNGTFQMTRSDTPRGGSMCPLTRFDTVWHEPHFLTHDLKNYQTIKHEQSDTCQIMSNDMYMTNWPVKITPDVPYPLCCRIHISADIAILPPARIKWGKIGILKAGNGWDTLGPLNPSIYPSIHPLRNEL